MAAGPRQDVGITPRGRGMPRARVRQSEQPSDTTCSEECGVHAEKHSRVLYVKMHFLPHLPPHISVRITPKR